MDKNDARQAYAIKLGDRYFYRFGKNGRVITAWCLGGARLFGTFNLRHEVANTVAKLIAAGKKPDVVQVREV